MAKFDPTRAGATSLVFSTFVGGTSRDEGYHLAVDEAGNAFVTGRTFSPDFPTASPYQGNLRGRSDAFLLQLSATAGLWPNSTFLGGSGDELGEGVTAGPAGSVVVAGSTASADFPTYRALRSQGEGVEAFVVRFAGSGPGPGHRVYLPHNLR